MPLVTNQGGRANACRHIQSGSSRVFVGGKGASRVAVDSAGGIILGPGSQNVFVEKSKLSMVGDVIASHGKAPHSNARTGQDQQRVFVGTGFLSDTDPVTGESVSTGDAPRPDIVVEEFTSNYGNGVIELYCSGQGIYPPTNMVSAKTFCTGAVAYGAPPPPENIVYSYQIKNVGRDTSQPQTVGFWLFKDPDEAPSVANLPAAGISNFPSAELIDTQDVPPLVPGQTYNGTFVHSEIYRSDFNEGSDPNLGFAEYTFGIYADIYQTVTEPDEGNSSDTIKIRVSNACGPRQGGLFDIG